MILKLLRELIEIQIVVSESPRRLLRPNASAFARIYHRLNESMFSAKIFLTAALYEPIMGVLSDSDTVLDVDPNKVVQSFSRKECLRRFGAEHTDEYRVNLQKFHAETITKLHVLAQSFIESLSSNWSLFPSTLRWLVQTICHQLKQAHFSEKIINEIISDMVFTHFICPAIVSPDIGGIINAPISEAVRLNLIQIGQIIQMMALAKHDAVEAKFSELHAKFDTNQVIQLIDLLLVSQSGEDVVAILSQQSDFERTQLLSTQSELSYFIEFFRILLLHEEFDVPAEDRNKLTKILAHLPASPVVGVATLPTGAIESNTKERSKQALINLGKVTKSKIAKSMSFSHANADAVVNGAVSNGVHQNIVQTLLSTMEVNGNTVSSSSSTNCSPTRAVPFTEQSDNEPILVFNIYKSGENKLQPLTEEEVLKMNSIGQEITNGDGLLVEVAESCNLENTLDKSSVANGFDGMSDDALRPLHAKTTHHARFSLSHDDASIGNSDNLEVVSEAPSNHSVTSSLELEENQLDQNDNLSDMVSANVSGRGTPNISGRDTPSSQVTDGESVTNALPTPQMQKLISKARSDIEDKFCKFEIKKFEGDETVSIISDTWSTDVLASDSETLDAGERERDRNFSTPLIPSAVVLPGDNNFDAVRPSVYLDASDQRSESNWSTDVLASDSEKMAEVDTDDNLSITARSDITDARSEPEPERCQRSAKSSRSISAHNASNINAINRNVKCSSVAGGSAASASVVGVGSAGGTGGHSSSTSSNGGNASDRSQEDSAFYDAINLYDEAGAVVASTSAVASHLLSSLARSSVRTTNQLSGENSFQQNYKSSSNNSDSKEEFLRQTSAESSISNQSISLDEAATMGLGKPTKFHHKSALKKRKQNGYHADGVPEVRDLIDFSDFSEVSDSNRPSDILVDFFVEDGVEHRRISLEQRSAGYDGRRNGILASKSGAAAEGAHEGADLPALTLRRHQSLNYENHEIMINNAVAPRCISVVPNIKSSALQTDDDKQHKLEEKQQLFLLSVKTEQLALNDTGKGQGLEEAPMKSTGAIPKSISFDASADKNAASQRSARVGSAEHNNNSSIFNKLKQGFFKHRRNNKSPHQRVAAGADEFGAATSSRSVSFNTDESPMDLFGGVRMRDNGAAAGSFGDISDDILAKYRRRVSTSSDVTNSDSMSNLAAGNHRTDADIQHTK